MYFNNNNYRVICIGTKKRRQMLAKFINDVKNGKSVCHVERLLMYHKLGGYKYRRKYVHGKIDGEYFMVEQNVVRIKLN